MASRAGGRERSKKLPLNDLTKGRSGSGPGILRGGGSARGGGTREKKRGGECSYLTP